MYNDLMIN